MGHMFLQSLILPLYKARLCPLLGRSSFCMLVWEGKLEAKEAGGLKAELMVMLNDVDVKSWFDGSYRIVNERNILTGVSGIKRPDRIMIGEKEVIVVDYKSGETESDRYKYQLNAYIRELKNCGYLNVAGYIWYTKFNKRVKV